MDKCDFIDDYVDKYKCIQNGGNKFEFNINDLLNEAFDTPSSQIELKILKERAFNELTDSELNNFRNYLVELSNQSGRDNRLQLRELAAGLYRHNNSNYSRVDEGYDNQYNDIERYRSEITFKPQSGYIKLDPIGGFADGKYTLRNYNITPISIGENIYNLDLEFILRKKQKGFNMQYKHNEHLEFKYNRYNHSLIIKHNSRRYNITLSNDNRYGHKPKHRHGGRHNRGEMLNIKIGNLKMKVFFKAD